MTAGGVARARGGLTASSFTVNLFEGITAALARQYVSSVSAGESELSESHIH